MASFMEKFSKNVKEDVGVRSDGHKPAESSQVVGRSRMKNAAQLDIECIEVDSQHREQFDEASIERLANSLRDHGQLQPIRVRWDEQREGYVLIAGERRLRAMKLADFQKVDCVIAEGELSEQDILTQQIIENCQREDLKPIERARAFRDLMEQNGWDGQQLAQQLHVSNATVSNALKLLALDKDTQDRVEQGQLTIKAAVATTRKTRGGAGGSGRARPPRPKTYRTKAGRVVVEPKVNGTYIDALREALEAATAQSQLIAKAA